MASVSNSTDAIASPYSLTIDRPNFPPSHYEEGDLGYQWENEVYLGDSPKDWRYLIAAGQDASSELLGTKLYVSQNSAYFTMQGLKSLALGERWTYNGFLSPASVGVIGADPVPNSAALHGAAGAVLSSYKAATASFRGFDFAAEFLEAVTLFTSPLKAIFGKSLDLAQKVGRARGVAFTRPQLYASKISSAYLGWQFAVNPLISDMGKAATAIAQIMERKAKVKSVSGNGENEVMVSLEQLTAISGYATYMKQVLRKSEVRFKGKVGMNFDTLAVQLAQFGFSPPDVIPAVWEAIPFSFLVDYFTNVGDVLYRGSTASGSPYLRYLVRGVRNTLKVEHSGIQQNGDHSDIRDGVYEVRSASGGSSKAHLVTVHRTGGSELPPVSLQFNVPSVGQLFNIGALISAVNASKPSRQF